MKRAITAGRLGKIKHHAIFVLFMSGLNPRATARLFGVPKRVVEDVIRRSAERKGAR